MRPVTRRRKINRSRRLTLFWQSDIRVACVARMEAETADKIPGVFGDLSPGLRMTRFSPYKIVYWERWVALTAWVSWVNGLLPEL